MDWSSIFQRFGGISLGVVSVGALVTFALKILVKKWVFEILEKRKAAYQKELEKLKIEGIKTTHTHKVQFEKEFEVYIELWKCAFRLFQAAVSLRPIFEYVDPNETEGVRKQRKLDTFYESIKNFHIMAHEYRPFYAPEIFEVSKKIINLTNMEKYSYHMKDPYSDGYYEEAEKNGKEILKLLEELSENIRSRIWSITVV